MRIEGYKGEYVRRELEDMPMAKCFGNGLINPTGYEVKKVGDSDHPMNWWNEYEDNGETWLGR